MCPVPPAAFSIMLPYASMKNSDALIWSQRSDDPEGLKVWTGGLKIAWMKNGCIPHLVAYF